MLATAFGRALLMGGGHKNNGVDSDGVLVEAALHNSLSLCFVWLVLAGFARRAFIVHVVFFLEVCPNEIV